MSMDATGEEMFGYFDNALSKNWAGPEHWKMRRVMQKKGG
jgi:condensin complex subunit 2